MFPHAPAALGLSLLLAAFPAFAQGGSGSWRDLEILREDRVQLGVAQHLRTRDHRWMSHELAIGNHGAAADLRRQLDGDEALVAQARTRLRQDEQGRAGGTVRF